MKIGKGMVVVFIFSVVVAVLATIPSDLKLGMTYFNSYDFESAFHYLVKVNKADSKNIFALKKIKDYFVVQGDLQKAIDIQKKVVALRPKNQEYIGELKKLSDWDRRPVDALKARELSFKFFKGEELYLEKTKVAEGYRYLKMYVDADRIFSEILGSQLPNNLRLASAFYISIGDVKKTTIFLENYLKLENDREMRKILAEAYQLSLNAGQALKNFLIYLNPRFKNPEDILNMPEKIFIEEFEYIRIVSKLTGLVFGKKRESEFWAEMFKAHPGLDFIAFAHSDRMKKSGNLEEIKSIYKIYESAMEESSSGLHQLALRWIEIKEYTQGLRIYHRIILKKNIMPTIYKELGEIYELIGNKDQALIYYYKYLSSSDKNGRSPSSIKKITERDRVILKVASLHYEKGEYKKSYALVAPVWENKNRDHDLAELILDLAIRFSENSTAEQAALYLIQKRPSHHQANLYYVNQLQGSGSVVKALNQLELAMKYRNLAQDPYYTVKKIELLALADKLDEYHEYCNHVISKASFTLDEEYLAVSRCYFNKQNRRLAIATLENALVKFPDSIELKNSAIYASLDAGETKAAESFIHEKEKTLGSDAESESQKNYLTYLRNKEQVEKQFKIKTTANAIKQGQLNYISGTAKVSKRFSSFESSIEYSRFSSDSEKKNHLEQVLPAISYYLNFGKITVGYLFNSSEHLGKMPISVELSVLNMEKIFWSFKLSSEIIDEERELLNRASLIKNSIESYLEWTPSTKNRFTTYFESKSPIVQDKKHTESTVGLSYLRKITKDHSFEMGPFLEAISESKYNENESDILKLGGVFGFDKKIGPLGLKTNIRANLGFQKKRGLVFGREINSLIEYDFIKNSSVGIDLSYSFENSGDKNNENIKGGLALNLIF
ncbi:MAG: tetratricopeptide repeat protein [Bacteriovoracaceae bacterium]|nr:tetratricopeptide repeat protein [Bacteriovoracaceae bacterium]